MFRLWPVAMSRRTFGYALWYSVSREMVERGLGWALMPEVALDNFKGYVKPCTFENGEPFVRRTYIFCQRDAAALPQVQLFMDMLKKHR